MARTKPPTKTITMPSAPEEPVPEPVTQRQQPDSGRFRLQVDRQTKGSYATFEAAETAGKGIKKSYPMRCTTALRASTRSSSCRNA